MKHDVILSTVGVTGLAPVYTWDVESGVEFKGKAHTNWQVLTPTWRLECEDKGEDQTLKTADGQDSNTLRTGRPPGPSGWQDERHW